MKEKIRKAFKFRLKPTPEQIRQMTEFAGCNRFVWNKAGPPHEKNYQGNLLKINRLCHTSESWYPGIFLRS